MAIIKLAGNKKYYIDKYLLEELDFDKKRLNVDWDAWYIIDGVEGSGKSTLAFSLAYYVDPNFSLNNVVWTVKEFLNAVESVPKGTAIVWDEFALVGMSKDALTKIQKIISKMAMTLRDRNLFIFLIIPYVFELQRYFVFRARMLLHTYTPDGISRGFWKLWHYDGKKYLYEKGRKFYVYEKPLADYKGTFGNTTGLFFDIIKYKERKKSAVDSISKEGDKDHKWKDERNAGILELKRCGYTQRQIGKVFGLSHQRIHEILSDKSNNIIGECEE